jgi:O-antigen ligase
MDTESHLLKIMEAQVHQTKMLVWILLVLVLALLLAACAGLLLVAVHFGFVRVSDLQGYLGLILVAFALSPIVYLLVLAVGSIAAGLGRFRAGRTTDAQIFREAIAERARALRRDSDP